MSNEHIENICNYIFLRKNNKRVKTPSEAILATYLLSVKQANANDKKRGRIAHNSYKKISKLLIFRNNITNLKKSIKSGNIQSAINCFGAFVASEEAQNFINSNPLVKGSIFARPNSIKTDKDLENDIKNEFHRYSKFHTYELPKKFAKLIDGKENDINILQKARHDIENVATKALKKSQEARADISSSIKKVVEDTGDNLKKVGDGIKDVFENPEKVVNEVKNSLKKSGKKDTQEKKSGKKDTQEKKSGKKRIDIKELDEMQGIKKSSGLKDVDVMQKIRKTEKILLNICDNIYEKSYKSSNKYFKEILVNDSNYMDCIYVSDDNNKERRSVHRIVVGKKGSLKGKKLKFLNLNSVENKHITNALEDGGDVYEFKKVSEGKTKEKYEYQREGSKKKMFSYRYRVYCNLLDTDEGIKGGSDKGTNFDLAPRIFEKLGYNISYTNNKEKYGALGIGTFNAAFAEGEEKKEAPIIGIFESSDKDKSISRVVRICIAGYKAVLNERKGNRTGCKVFDSIKDLDKNGEDIRKLFYQNKNFVFSKNKEFSQVSKTLGDNTIQQDLWYCISTGEYRPDGDADEIDSTYVERFNSNENERLIELQAFTKGLLESLAKMHARGIVHLDVKPANTLKKPTKNESAPYYTYALTDFGTATDIGKRVKETPPEELTWDVLCNDLSNGSSAYTNSSAAKKQLKGLPEVKPELIYKLDSMAVATSMAAFYKFNLVGNGKEFDDMTDMTKDTFVSLGHEMGKGKDALQISWLPDGDAKDLAIKLMDEDITKRWSCTKALNEHPFITKKL